MIKIRSKYDLDIFRVFQKFNYKRIFVLSYICGILLFLIGILFAFLENVTYVGYLLFGVLLPLFMHISFKIIEVENINKNIYLKTGAVQFFTFDDEGIHLEQISHIDTFKDKYLYNDIVRIIKYKKYYFLYVNRVQALILRNEDYVLGDELSLDELFKHKKGKDFVKKRVRRKK